MTRGNYWRGKKRLNPRVKLLELLKKATSIACGSRFAEKFLAEAWHEAALVQDFWGLGVVFFRTRLGGSCGYIASVGHPTAMSDVDYLVRKLGAGTVTVKHGIRHHNLATVPFPILALLLEIWTVKMDDTDVGSARPRSANLPLPPYTHGGRPYESIELAQRALEDRDRGAKPFSSKIWRPECTICSDMSGREFRGIPRRKSGGAPSGSERDFRRGLRPTSSSGTSGYIASEERWGTRASRSVISDVDSVSPCRQELRAYRVGRALGHPSLSERDFRCGLRPTSSSSSMRKSTGGGSGEG
ncbi:hypothetical protein B0H14DRAFT_2585924 [Mycena olivaceomarginata]|nr:hypothetical protein B0H14DRAFT_2585924 [Mycena olivaceomarginata]